MLSVSEFLNAVEEISAENPSYRKGGSGFDGTCDCIGLIIGAIQRCGGKWSGIHGSNWAARNEVSDLRKITSNADLSVGDLVFKAIAPGRPGNDLPSRYNSHPDKNDYYHIGVVKSVYPLRIRHMTTPAVQTDTKLGAWTYHGWCKQVRKEKQNNPDSDAGINVDRLHACLAEIEKQLKAIYEITGGRG